MTHISPQKLAARGIKLVLADLDNTLVPYRATEPPAEIVAWKEALEQAGKLPNLYKARENALVFFLEGEERHETAKAALEPLAWSAELHLSILAEALGKPAYLEKAQEIRRLLLGHGEEDSAGPVQERRQNEPRDEKRG